MGDQSTLLQKYKQKQVAKFGSTTPDATTDRSTAARLGLILLPAIFVIFAGLYSVLVPITQGEDELAHFRYISFIAQTGRLPINFEERERAWYRADWPPLYHLLVGWAVSPLDTGQPHLKDVGEAAYRRLVGEIFYPRLIIYTEDADWPWQDGILAWHIGRFISIIFSAGALVFTTLTALDVFRFFYVQSAQLLALLTTALLAFTPRFLFTSAMLGDDSLFILLSSIFIWLLIRALRGDDSWSGYVFMGLTLGLSIVTKYSTGLLPLAIIPVALWRAKQSNWPWPQWLGRVAVSWGAVVLGASWWFGWIGYYFNTISRDGLIFGLLSPLLNAGPDVSMKRIFAFFTGGEFTGPARPAAIEAGTLWEWLVYLFQTFWGVPVLEVSPLFPWAYLLMLALCIAALLGLGQLWRTANPPARKLIGLLALIVALLLPFPVLRFFLTKNVLETGQGRHILYPAAQSIPILLMLGWATFLSYVDQWRKANTKTRPTPPYVLRSTNFLLLIPALLLIWSIFQYGYMAATFPDPLPVRTSTFNPDSIPQPVIPHKFGDNIQLLGYDFQPDPETAIIDLTLFWEALAPVDENYRVQVELLDTDRQAHFIWLSHPVNGLYPTRAWDKGDVVRDELPLPLAAVPAGNYTLSVNLLPEADDTPLLSDSYWLVQLPLGQRQPIAQAETVQGVDFRLWVADQPVRQRQTLPLSWLAQDEALAVDWSLVGPDQVPRPPSASSDNTGIFIVGADWPSGDYRLQVTPNSADPVLTETVVTVANDRRLFEFTPPKNYMPLEANFAHQVKLLGYSLPTRRVEPGAGLPLTLFWQSLAPVLGDYIVFDVLLDENQQRFGGYDRLPLEFYSTMLWAEGEIVEDGFAVPVQPNAPPGVYTLRVGLYSEEANGPVSLPIYHDGQPTGSTSVSLGPIKVGGPPPSLVTNQPNPQVPLQQSFGGKITLLGYDLEMMASTVNLALYWRADTDVQTNYTTFLHVRDQTNAVVKQKDSPPAGGRYPTALWQSGEIVVDRLTLPVDDVPLGEYSLVVGLYDSATLDRLLTEANPANEIRLESISLP